ncbi:MAG: DUF362 domain-containing protein [Bacteroides sp.]|nr:DUF362 domain-containing protein [Bacteroides sp.]
MRNIFFIPKDHRKAIGNLILLFVILFTGSSFTPKEAQGNDTSQESPVKQCLLPNQPVGTARGIFPGRVTWSHAPGAARWDEGDSFWFDDRFNNQEDCNWLIAQTLRSLTGTKNPKAAWKTLFKYYNSNHGKGKAGYVPNEKIAIKINNNNTYAHDDCKEINTSPQMLLALLKSLVYDAGVPQEAITVAEPSRFITNYLFEKCHNAFPNVRFVDNHGGDGRIKSDYVADAMVYSRDNGPVARGIATAFTEADYVINMALLKGHVGQGVTLCGKNWYGTMSIHADWRKNFHNNFNQSADGTPKYITFVDFMGHKDLGGKGLLWLIDGLYGCKKVDGAPSPKWNMEPFNGDWPCSLFGSLDPVAIDMVGNDFLINQFPDMPDVNYSDMYLMEAAQADHAPSGIRYDPEGDGTTLPSLGVAEHWNNPKDKQYSRNLGTGKGIELIYTKK